MIELLAPAGSMEALQAAIYGGADAIYVGGSKFNARAYATNFDIDELKEAVRLCHLHGVKLYVTVNTVYKEDEIEAIYDYLKKLYEIQVDALIVQDEGIMDLIQNHFKDFEIHASTQCSIHNLDGIKHYENKGVARVVLARENSLEEISYMASNTHLEIEAFVHGALCVAYSGQCYLSQSIGQRSANRGQCAQPCRLPYTLYKDDKKISDKAYLMSCKDLCTIDHVKDLIKAGVKSFKIEGRMKRAEYVYTITHSYRQAIDQVQRDFDNNALRQLFNRDFTPGYLFKENKITSAIYSGNRGILLGKVVNCQHGKVSIKALVDVKQGDGIRFGFEDEGKILNKIYYKNKLVNSVEKGQVFEIEVNQKIKNGQEIYRTISASLEKNINNQIHQLTRYIPITMQLKGEVGEPLSLTIKDHEGFKVTLKTNDVLEKAQKPTDIDRMKAQLAKLGQTIYQAADIKMDIAQDIFIPIAKLNELRRSAIESLNQLRQNRCVRQVNEIKPLQIPTVKNKVCLPRYYHFHNQAQFEASRPFLNGEMCFIDDIIAFKKLFKTYPNLGLVIPTVCNEETFKLYDKVCENYPDVVFAVNNIGAYERYKKHVALLLPGFNLSHQLSLDDYDIACVISLDLSKEEVSILDQKGVSFVTQVYGHFDAMTTKHCPISVNTYGYKKVKCLLCHQGQYALADRIGVKFPLQCNNQCIVSVLSNKPISLRKAQSEYLRFTIEDEKQTLQIMQQYQK